MSLYIHIPFCRKKCLYCGFYSTTYDKNLASDYIKAIEKEIDRLEGKFSTIYIGGGTPTVLELDLLKSLLKKLHKHLLPGTEFTIEANPESLTKEKIKLFLNSGINRISVGIQSFNDAKLKKLSRIHDAKKAKEVVLLAFKNGFKNISIDLIFGVYGESLNDWQKELSVAAKLPIKHISCYGLTYERNTPLLSLLEQGKVQKINDDTEARMYKTAMEFLPENDFRQYEISNFAKKGFECRHNLSYWDNDEYFGLGASAVSYIDGRRSQNILDIYEYTGRAIRGVSVIATSEKLSKRKSAGETAAVKIRTSTGIDLEWFKEKTGFDILETKRKSIEKMTEQGLLKYIKKNNNISAVKLTKKGFIFCDIVSSQLL